MPTAECAASDLSGLVRPYLQALTDELKGRVPSDVGDALVGESAGWLEHQAYDYVLQGADLKTAVDQAIARHGMPRALALTMSEQWFESRVDSPIQRKLGRANTIAGAVFGMGNLLAIVLLQAASLFPSDRARLPFSPAVVRSVLPDYLPFPELTWQFGAPLFAIFFLPLALGAIVGGQVPVRASAAVYRVMCPVMLSAFLLGCLLLPNTAGLLFALIQTVFWLPMGCLVAHITSTLARRKRAKTQENGSAAGPRTPETKRIGAT